MKLCSEALFSIIKNAFLNMRRFSIGDKVSLQCGLIYWSKIPQAAELLKTSFLLISTELTPQPVSL